MSDAAFPQISTEPMVAKWDTKSYGKVTSSGGLTKRELFSAMALQGILSRASQPKDPIKAAIDYADTLIKTLGDQG